MLPVVGQAVGLPGVTVGPCVTGETVVGLELGDPGVTVGPKVSPATEF